MIFYLIYKRNAEGSALKFIHLYSQFHVLQVYHIIPVIFYIGAGKLEGRGSAESEQHNISNLTAAPEAIKTLYDCMCGSKRMVTCEILYLNTSMSHHWPQWQ